MVDLPKHNATVDLATIPLELVKATRSGSYEFSTTYEDALVDGLQFRSAYQDNPARWSMCIRRGIVLCYLQIGVYPSMSVDEARDAARAKLASIEAQMLPATTDECAAYDLALMALKSGKDTWTDVLQGFLRIAQVPQEAEKEINTPLERLPRSAVLRIPVTDLEVPLSVRAKNALKFEGVKTVAHLLLLSDHELLSIPNFGKTSLAEVRAAMRATLAKSPEAKWSQAGLSAAVAFQRQILAQLEEQTALARSSLSMLESAIASVDNDIAGLAITDPPRASLPVHDSTLTPGGSA